MENQNTFHPGISHETIKTSDWFLTMLITAIPIVGFIMLFVWAFGGGTNPCKANWAKASLLWVLIGIVLVVLLVLIFGVFVSSMVSDSKFS